VCVTPCFVKTDWPTIIQTVSAAAAIILAAVALGKQWRDEWRHRKAVDGRISPQAYAARRTLRSWLTDPQLAVLGNHPSFWVQFANKISSHFAATEKRFERIAADAPEASPAVGDAVRDAYVLFYNATGRINEALAAANVTGPSPGTIQEIQQALKDFESCIDPLTHAIDEKLRDR
jgi:hypothetical protein